MKQIGFFFFLLLMWSCAQVVAPSGGPRDTEPPKIVNSNPQNFSTNVKTNSIELEFNEYVIQKNLNSELLISPPLKNNPDYYFKGKRFYLAFDDTLKENVTYQFNFGKSLVDLNENNPLDSNLIVFSTGDYLDSLSVSGSLIDAQTLKPEKDILVMLYKSEDDSIPCKSRPDYFTRTDKLGNFELNYLANGKYQIFALEDKNSNFLFDLPNERIAFIKETFFLQKDTTFTLRMFEEENKTQAFKGLQLISPFLLQAEFSLPTQNIQLIPINKTFKKPWYFNNDSVSNDSIQFWIPDPFILDTLELQVYEGNNLLDTADLIFPKEESKKKPLKFKLNPSNINAGLPYFQPLKISANLPIYTINTNKIFLIEDSLQVPTTINFTPKSKFIEIQYAWNPELKYTIVIEDSSVVGLGEKQNTDSLFNKFSVRGESKFGSMEVVFPDVDSTQHLMLLLQDKAGLKNFATQIGFSSSEFKFNNLPVGSYLLKVIFDDDQNGQYTTGKYGTKKQPEKSFIYEGSAEIKENFDAEIKWYFTKELLEDEQ